jgi:hypothetical protein
MTGLTELQETLPPPMLESMRGLTNQVPSYDDTHEVLIWCRWTDRAGTPYLHVGDQITVCWNDTIESDPYTVSIQNMASQEDVVIRLPIPPALIGSGTATIQFRVVSTNDKGQSVLVSRRCQVTLN